MRMGKRQRQGESILEEADSCMPATKPPGSIVSSVQEESQPAHSSCPLKGKSMRWHRRQNLQHNSAGRGFEGCGQLLAIGSAYQGLRSMLCSNTQDSVADASEQPDAVKTFLERSPERHMATLRDIIGIDGRPGYTLQMKKTECIAGKQIQQPYCVQRRTRYNTWCSVALD
ncbi:hypothetical protein BDZ85DRAFT_304933 [Elsinoe ampelina]|uniref:Uncharacterized protein n=1 Tax=Elsinoe ampelina TaxID=302913 RepID=A0A6A6G170_9PEZI|nr:hypothetical protein BDZ85DRAFT_304933 [Elsinoe ampelina]